MDTLNSCKHHRFPWRRNLNQFQFQSLKHWIVVATFDTIDERCLFFIGIYGNFESEEEKVFISFTGRIVDCESLLLVSLKFREVFKDWHSSNIIIWASPESEIKRRIDIHSEDVILVVKDNHLTTQCLIEYLIIVNWFIWFQIESL